MGGGDNNDERTVSYDGGKEENPVSLTIFGSSCSVHHNLSNYLLQSKNVGDVETRLNSCSKLLSLLLLESRGFDSYVTLPFFLALPPPGTDKDLQLNLLTASLQHLYSLFGVNNASFASQLIRLFSASIRTGGGRWHETILQNGTIHVLVSALRQSLVRAEYLDVQNFETYASFIKAQAASGLAGKSAHGSTMKTKMTVTMSSLPVSPSKIPISVIEATIDLLDACCGPPCPYLEDMDPSFQIQRTSDLALTCLFGMAFDWDLWGKDLRGACLMLEAVAERYGGDCVTYGYILRSQVSVQYFLDAMKAKIHRGRSIDETFESQQLLDRICISCAKILGSMMLSSLSNSRSVSQSEHDISAIVGILSDSPLGCVSSRIIFKALTRVLHWCEIIPIDPTEDVVDETGTTAGSIWNQPDRKNKSSTYQKSRTDDDHKCQVASRLARNLLTSQFHTVVVPIVLSRTVYSPESGARKTSRGATDSALPSSISTSSISQKAWKEDWSLCLTIFSWLSSIAGPEGIAAAQSLGSLVLASGQAGSISGALEFSSKILVANLFLPSPSMALTVASTSRRDSFSYTDLLESRLSVMMPILPALVVSLLGPPSSLELPSSNSVGILAELITAMGGAFHRLFGGMTHMAGSKRTKGQSSVDIKAVESAKNFVPYLVEVAMILEQRRWIYDRQSSSNVNERSPIKILTPAVSQSTISDGSWVEVSSTINESVMSNGSVNIPKGGISDVTNESFLVLLKACQGSISTTIVELSTYAMRFGGEESTQLLKTILATLKNSESLSLVFDSSSAITDGVGNLISFNFLCRILAMLLNNCLERDHHWELWSMDLGVGVSRVCLLVEEKELLLRPVGTDKRYSEDQVLLICSLSHVLRYGRDSAGWCQLALPSPPQPSALVKGDNEGSIPPANESLGARSRESSGAESAADIMLPVLYPSLRVLVECMGVVKGDLRIAVSPENSPHDLGQPEKDNGDVSSSNSVQKEVSVLLEYMVDELRLSLMAAIVGMSFANARDISLHAMATFRRARKSYLDASDALGAKLCAKLLCMIIEEIRVRYDGERRRRGSALFDAYEDQHDLGTSASAAADSQVVENLILGGNIIPEVAGGNRKSIEEVSFVADAHAPDRTGDDFVLFDDGLGKSLATSQPSSGARMDWSRYEGLGSALEKCSQLAADGGPIDGDKDNPVSSDETVLEVLAVFLDSWDENAAVEAADTEMVKLFDLSNEIEADGSLSEGNAQTVSYGMEGSETAAVAMTEFIEMAGQEKARVMDLSSMFLPNHRYSSMAFMERYCWARYMEVSPTDDLCQWERGVADGNRDVRSRLVTMPCSPQFKRYIPRYMDHSSDLESTSSVPVSSEAETGNTYDVSNIDAFTQTLINTGHLEIVDITKKESQQEVEFSDNVPLQVALDDDFEERPLEVPTTSVETEKSLPSGDDKTSSATTTDESSTGSAGKTEEEREEFVLSKLGSNQVNNVTASAFAGPPDNSSTTLGLMHSAAAGLIEKHIDGCLHVKAEGSRKCSMLLTSTHLILEYEIDSQGHYEGELMAVREEAERQRMIEETGGESPQTIEKSQDDIERRQRDAANLRPRSIRWNLSELSHVYLRRYRLRDSSVELFFIPSGGTSFGGYGLFSPSTSLFLDFGPGSDGDSRRDDAAFAIMKRAPPQAIKQWPDRSAQFLHEQLSRLTLGWVEKRISNFDYLLHLNVLAGRSYNDTCQYPVMPWVLSNYKSTEIPDLLDPTNYRDLSKPVGALNPSRLEDFIERFNTFADPSIPPFMYGSHYSTNAGVVLHFLVRLHPYAQLHRQLQGGHFDVADRLFSSVPRTWDMCTGSSAAEVKELTPEWYCNPTFLKNTNKFKLGTSQDGDVLGDVVLPPWADGSPEKFIEVMRNALESDICSAMLPDWIDLVFGRKQQGPEAIAAHNVFFYLTYYGSVNVSAIEDEGLRQATELQIAHFGQCPMQLFVRPHVRRVQHVNKKRLSFYQIISAYTHYVSPKDDTDEDGKKSDLTMDTVFQRPLYLPFFSAPLSHWVHLSAPPPGPHADLIGVRLAGTDRCLAVDARGVFHCFRWAWKNEESLDSANDSSFPLDAGCFVAQRELPRFQQLPRLVHAPPPGERPAVAISKTLFAGRSVLLVLSDGDGRGGLAMQLVDPAKGTVRGEAVISSVHASAISAIATDPIGTAAGHGGVGGELAIVGSADGNASIWRFMSSHYLPLRPRVRLAGHGGVPIHAVGLSAAINVAVTVSTKCLCIHSIGNGNIIRIIEPPDCAVNFSGDTGAETSFAVSSAVAISVQGFVVTVCQTNIKSTGRKLDRSIISLNLFSLEGVSLGSKALESWRGVPHKITATPDGTAILVCSGRGVTVHRLSAITPLEFIDEWHVTESEELSADMQTAFDIDLGPSLNRPVVAAAACSDGALRLHALAGIGPFSERHKKAGITQSVGSAARRIKNVFGKASNITRTVVDTGSKASTVGKEISKEISDDVRERGVTGFLGGMFTKKK
eukprot:CAMPEP_0113450404 /NCGR_PEP_ID=MMETSP0014_2-20120614/5812_1 /TAXON_ID=2857 /ORGANISM="Nitzschia sp." /LENGTH=2495 /DNA_ID=CAMNT_0000341741 /DNA_START=29 /DNA_END=7516 /DNA_ORIENTATION=- /assembly_acc=CAM_ASM_000159